MQEDNNDTEYLIHHEGSDTIWFYADIDEISCLSLNAALHKADKANFCKNDPVINLRICSYGGSVLAALATINVMRNLRSKIHTYVDGGAASAATLISCMGQHRVIGKHSFMLIHQLSGEVGGKLAEMEDGITNNRQFMTMIRRIYKEQTKMPQKRMDELLKADLWIGAEECKKLGLVDEII